MRRFAMMSMILSGLLALAAGGCGVITPATVMMKGATWVAEQGVKRGIKHLREQRHNKTHGKATNKSTSRPAREQY
jgi:hypothetical protein